MRFALNCCFVLNVILRLNFKLLHSRHHTNFMRAQTWKGMLLCPTRL